MTRASATVQLRGITRLAMLYSELLAEVQGVDSDKVMEETVLYLAGCDGPNEDQPGHRE